MTGDTYTGPTAGQYGNHNQQNNTFYGLSRTPASWPHQVGVLPGRAQSFQHRAEVQRLRQALAGGGTAVVGQVLTGMGGVGKTQLAADYARSAWHADEVDVLVWTTASDATAAASGYAQAGMEVLGADPAFPQRAAQAFLAWLEPKPQERPCRWLVVLDDVTDPAHLNGLWPPNSPHGRTLVTTRRRDAALTGTGRHTIEVGLFTKDEALAYLTTSLAGHRDDEAIDQLAALAGDLGLLPLALAQAVAYLIDTGETVAAYRHLLADRTTTLADTAPDVLPDDQALPLAAAWSLSIDRADVLHPVGLARPMLQLTSFLDPNGIPQSILTSSPALAHLTARRTRIGPDAAGAPHRASSRDAVRALRALHRLSLIDHTPSTPHQAVRVHQLIQRASRDTLTTDQRDQAVRTAADALMAAWPDVERDTILAQALRANTTTVADHAGHALYRPDTHAVLYRTGTSLGETGQVAAARDYYQRLTDTTTSYLGADHPDALKVQGNLAQWRGEAGDAAGAADVFAQLLEPMVRVLGPDHSDTLTTRGSLALWRGEAGDAAAAAADFAELLPDQLRILGPDAPDTLTTRHNLARWRGRAGDAATAAAGLADLLSDQLRVLGEDHPDTLVTRGNLAQWRGMAGDPTTAAADLAKLLKHKERVLGADHPHTLATRHMLAFWRSRAGGNGSALGE
ncbi:tetratricopeptide repeat protein [Streptomyces sp. MBT62]|uniref:tetratricopeptide repeat protein n=1 Tax=Streptomyces sp. MBT62 TaxID=2800410 RepID=UPI00190AD4DE|nr:tetratricopeptide repeat protein [Streptomyces sp. MBT62]MBK3567379.1 tetratricopeptide repeat protein [Streptomyces sp. MBT62]